MNLFMTSFQEGIQYMLAISTPLNTLACPLSTPIGPVVLFPTSSSSTFRLYVIAYVFCVFSCVFARKHKHVCVFACAYVRKHLCVCL